MSDESEALDTIVAESCGDMDEVIERRKLDWKPPPRLTLSQWADERFYLSPESSAAPGRWSTLPYQRELMDVITDPRVYQVSVIKSARVGYTKGCVDAAIGYFIDHDPCSILVVQPTVEDAKGFSKEEIAPMLRDCPTLTAKVLDDPDADAGPRDGSNTILHKKFPGGVLSMVGANSGAGFRRISRRVVIFDEVDAYPSSAGSDGDPIALGTKRTETFWNRKIIAGSTPLRAGESRIESLYLEGDQRRYYVPCPHCKQMDYLVFRKTDTGGHWMEFDTQFPDAAHFVCSACDEAIEHRFKMWMLDHGEWRASAEFHGHASFHIWAAYSTSVNATWSDIAKEYLLSKDTPDRLKTFVNTVLGETWKDKGEAPAWDKLFSRREPYAMGTVPAGVEFLTAGMDVQKDRVVFEVVGWGFDKQSWSVDAGVIPFDTGAEAGWTHVDEWLNRTYTNALGAQMTVRMLAIDSGYNTQQVYNWVRRYPSDRVIAVKGVHTARTLVGSPSPVDVTHRGKRIARGCKVWPVGTHLAKSELYGWLRLPAPMDEGQPYPGGFAHFPEHGKDYFMQLTAEHLVSVRNKRTGFVAYEWQVIPGRENHYLDARVYARVASAVLGLDRMKQKTEAPAQPVIASPPGPGPVPIPDSKPQPERKPGAFLGSSNSRANRGKPWLSRGDE